MPSPIASSMLERRRNSVLRLLQPQQASDNNTIAIECAHEGSPVYRCGRVIGHFTFQRMVGWIHFVRECNCHYWRFLGALEILRYEREGPWPMACHFPCDDERTIALLWTNALRAYEGKSSELIPPGPRSRESVQDA